MENVTALRKHGLFDAKVPRYTSYPPANRFEPHTGRLHHRELLAAVEPDKPVSVYFHVPFCRRLCWFCACRTQGTKTLRVVNNYVSDLEKELKQTVAQLPKKLAMSRLHFGGGTPTLLSPALLDRLLFQIDQHFDRAQDFEFSVEVDPTEAPDDVLDSLAHWGMRRASIGVQDFNPSVQEAIGRAQSFEQTRHVVDHMRRNRVESLNVDLLYGLPRQTTETLVDTLDRVAELRPDRIALYGYAHVPHVSKRQIMIPEALLPRPERRHEMSEMARERLCAIGYEAIGIDHFALPTDSLALAARNGRLKRNFQGYTDDPCDTLLGFGASSISKFPKGYVQNAVSTAAYSELVRAGESAARKGFLLSNEDTLIARMIDGLMCYARVDGDRLARQFPARKSDINSSLKDLQRAFPELVELETNTLSLRPGMHAAARLIAARLDHELKSGHVHSLAV